MMTRPISYRTKSLEQLIKLYADEDTRINSEDKEVTRAFIKNEILQRVKDTFNMLDENPEDADKIYHQLINH